MKISTHLQPPSTGTAQFPNGEFASSPGGDAQRQRRPSSSNNHVFEAESIARRAEQVEVCARHLLAGAFQSNQDCVEAIAAIHAAPQELWPVFVERCWHRIGQIAAVLKNLRDIPHLFDHTYHGALALTPWTKTTFCVPMCQTIEMPGEGG